MSLGLHIELVFTFSTPWVSFILKYSYFLLLFSLLHVFFPCTFLP